MFRDQLKRWLGAGSRVGGRLAVAAIYLALTTFPSSATGAALPIGDPSGSLEVDDRRTRDRRDQAI